MSAPTIEEECLLKQFHDRVADVLETENQRKSSFLIRWLRARGLDLDRAENMLRSSLEWRKANQIDHVLVLPVDNYFQQEHPYYIAGIDKYEHPVVVIPAGNWDFRKCVANKTTEEITHFVNHCFETVCRAIDTSNNNRDPDLYPVTQFTLLIDWKGYSYMQLCSLKALQNMLYGAKLLEAHYPEIGFQCLFINCPSFLNVLLRMAKNILPAETYNKINVYGTDRKEWELACREIIDDDQLVKILKVIC